MDAPRVAGKKRKRLSKAERMARKQERQANALKEASVDQVESLGELLRGKQFDKLEPLGTSKPYLRLKIIFGLFEARENAKALFLLSRFRRLDHEFPFPIVKLVQKLQQELSAIVASKVIHGLKRYPFPASLLSSICLDLIGLEYFHYAFAIVETYADVRTLLRSELLSKEDLLNKVAGKKLSPKSLSVKQNRFLRSVFKLREEENIQKGSTCIVTRPLQSNGLCPIANGVAEEVAKLIESEAEVFGSRAIPGMYGPSSDVDILLPTTPESQMSTVAKLLSDSTVKSFSDVKQVREAFVPIVTCVHVPSGLVCDLSFAANAPSLTNSRALAECCKQVWFVPNFLRAVRHWARQYDLVARGNKGFQMNKFGWDLLALRFLQDIGTLGTLVISSGDVAIEKHTKEPLKDPPSSIDIGSLLRQFWIQLTRPNDGKVLSLQQLDKDATEITSMPSMWILLDPGSNRNIVRKLTRFDQEKIRVSAIKCVLGHTESIETPP